jgi:putative redox protein
MCPQFCDAPQARDQPFFRAGIGGDVRVGRTILGDTDAPGPHISFHIGYTPDGENGAGAVLTPGEARQLAAALLQQAAAADGSSDDATTGQLEVSYLGGESYAVVTRGHTLLTDQPTTAGGADTALTPTELLVASLSSCAAFYAGRYLARHGLNRDGLHVTATFTTATNRPARIGEVRLTIQVPEGIPAHRQAALLAVASHCTVHNTLRHPPDIAIELA